MTNVKARMAALSLLDRALAAMSDTDLVATVTALPEDHREALEKLAGPESADGLVPALRVAIQKGRINGSMEQIAMVVSDACLAECIEKLGDDADHPTEEQLLEVLPGLVETHGVETVRVMMASAVVGEAHASAALIHLLRHDEVVKLPPIEMKPIAPLLPTTSASDDVKAARKARKDREKAEARARREQSVRDRAKA